MKCGDKMQAGFPWNAATRRRFGRRDLSRRIAASRSKFTTAPS
jgi:hypothetical protein